MAFLDNLLPGLVTALVTLGLGWMIGNRISEKWAIHQKRRELELEANTQFYQLYGEFYAIWKLWNYSLKTPGKMETLTEGETSLPEQIRWNLLERALLAEGKVEAILVKLASERDLSKGAIETCGSTDYRVLSRLPIRMELVDRQSHDGGGIGARAAPAPLFQADMADVGHRPFDQAAAHRIALRLPAGRGAQPLLPLSPTGFEAHQ